MSDRAALVIGISEYEESGIFGPLPGAINDANAMYEMLSKNDDEGQNLAVELLSSEKGGTLTKHLKGQIHLHLEAPLRLVVIYFSGHGFLDGTGDIGYLVAADGDEGRPGVDMGWILNQVNRTQERNSIRSVVIILDCCHAGAMGAGGGTRAGIPSTTVQRGVTILAACEDDQKAKEVGGVGRFTGLLIDGLKGAAADIAGNVTPAALYSHVDQSLGAIEQRPVFATNVNRTVTLRKCAPKIDAKILRKLPEFFSNFDQEIQLNPSWEPDRGRDFDKIVKNDPEQRKLKDYPVDEEKTKQFAKLQKLSSQGLVKPVGESHMFFAAINSKSCALTDLGKHYWRLAKAGQIR